MEIFQPCDHHVMYISSDSSGSNSETKKCRGQGVPKVGTALHSGTQDCEERDLRIGTEAGQTQNPAILQNASEL